MYKKLECIALRTVRYSDRNSILTAYTRQEGRLSFLLPAGNGKDARRIRALLMPLGRFDCEADLRPGRDIFPLRDVKAVMLPPAADPIRSSLAIFITDFMQTLLREPMPDPAIFSFLEQTIDAMSTDPRRSSRPLTGNALANLHIHFLIRLTRFLGIEPDWHSYTEGAFLDMAGGVFRQMPPPHNRFLPAVESAAAIRLSKMEYRNLHRFRLTRADRNLIIDRLIQYYTIHFPTFSAPSSLPILRML